MSEKIVKVIGGGLAGSEAAWQIAEQGVQVRLFEMKPVKKSAAHRTDQFAELVCSNSLGSTKLATGSAQLKDEISTLNSMILRAARSNAVPAGHALAVDREGFSLEVTRLVENHPRIEIVREEVSTINPDELTVVATGPLTSQPLARAIAELLGDRFLYFYDAIAPTVEADSLNMERLYFASRYEQDNHDYLNIPLTQSQYEELVNDLKSAEKVPLHAFEEPKYYEACLPIDVLAERGDKTLSFGCFKPVGLDDPRTGKRPYAVVQLRRENYPTTMYSLVGCQNKLKYGEQVRIFKKLPGLEDASFVRMGSIHRNTYIHSPTVLSTSLSLKQSPNIFFAGQISGVEGYLESTSMGLVAGLFAAARAKNVPLSPLPRETMLGSMIHYLCSPVKNRDEFQPMNANYALMPVVEGPGGRKNRPARRAMMNQRASEALASWRQTEKLFSGLNLQAKVAQAIR